ncbi:MAG: S1 RNA-binding domain-containing protein [Candidatus Paceibacterota bacterium]|jgi:small subunit ribosomal protein S1
MNIVKNGMLMLAQLVKTAPQLFSPLKVGDLVEGKIIEKSSNRILLDLGKNGTGVVYRGELQNARDLVRSVECGGVINGKVVEIDNGEGYVELSLTEAGRQKAWQEIDELKGKDEAFAVKPTGYNKGGLIVNIRGVGAFLPVSQLSIDHYPKIGVGDRTDIASALQKLVGEEIIVKIIDANQRNGKLIVSEKEAVEISSRELVKNYSVGQVIEAIVSGVADFGVFVKFVDNPSVEGLIHVSELDYCVVENPKEIVKIDEVIKAKIMEIKDGKISLSIKVLKEDPWAASAERYKEGLTVQGTVYMFNPFGAVINIDKETQGYVHVTDFGGAEEMKKELIPQKEYTFVVESIKPEERRINLKLVK